MFLGYVHDLVKGKPGKQESGKARLIQTRGRRGKDANVVRDDVTMNIMFVIPLQLSRTKCWVRRAKHHCKRWILLKKKGEIVSFYFIIFNMNNVNLQTWWKKWLLCCAVVVLLLFLIWQKEKGEKMCLGRSKCYVVLLLCYYFSRLCRRYRKKIASRKK